MDDSIETITSTLLSRARAGDDAAWHKIVHLYGALVCRWCRLPAFNLRDQDVEDIHQNVFIAVYRGLESFEHENFRGWLRRITQNKIKDLFKRRKGKTGAEGGTTHNERMADVPIEIPSDETANAEDVKLLHARVMDLIQNDFSDRDGEVFRRLVVEGEKPADIAKDLGITVANVYVIKSRILRRVRKEFGDLDSN